MSVEQTGESQGEQNSPFLDMVKKHNEERSAALDGENNGRQTQEETPKEEPSKGQPEGQDQGQEEGQKEEVSLLADPLGDKDLKPKRPTKDDNIKNLRSSLNSERARIQELEAELEAARQAASNPELPEETQNEIKAKDERLAALEHYEKLFGLYNTDGFKETYYDSVEALSAKAKEIAHDYDVSHEVIDSVMGIGNRKELIETLGNYFDIHTAGEIRDIVLEAQGIIKAREEAEKNPEEVRSQLLSLVGKNNEAKINKARQNMQGAVATGWTRMLETYSNPKTGISALIEKPGDATHTKNREQILKSAEKDLSAVMGIFAKDGLNTISDEVATAIAARFQLSAAAGWMHKRLQEAEAKIAEMESSARKTTKYSRPLNREGGSGKGGGAVPDDAPAGKDLAAHVFETARQKMESQG